LRRAAGTDLAQLGRFSRRKRWQINNEASLSIENLSKRKLNDDGESDSEKRDGLGQRRCALAERRWIERRCGYNGPFLAARNRAGENGKAKRLND
jgi:hypothetical protein